MTVIESPGYTPFEQLQSRGNVGPWSDLYALGATLVKAITFEGIPKAADRVLDDPWKGLANHRDASQRYSFDFLYSIDRSLEPMPSTRWQQAKEWREELNGRSSDAGQPVQIQSKQNPPPLPAVNVPSGQDNRHEQSEQKPELWNPSIAANLSFFLSAAFGAYLHARNAKELGLVDQEKINNRWFYSLAIIQVSSLFVMSEKFSGYIFFNIITLIIWYYTAAIKQIQIVKDRYQKKYIRKTIFGPIFAFALIYFLMACLVHSILVDTGNEDIAANTDGIEQGSSTPDKNNEAITRKGQIVGVTQYLMRIPVDEYRAIQHHKLDEVREIERSIGKKNIKDLPEYYY
jgi:serine/threonine protein kinase